MFTRCPECETVFRLTASALKQAEGKVRCGACNSTFNALQSLAEDFIDPDSARQFAEQAIDDGHISKEQGDALLQSLDRLEVPDVELEDTGVEWRVLQPPAELIDVDEDDLGADASGIIVSADEDDATGDRDGDMSEPDGKPGEYDAAPENEDDVDDLDGDEELDDEDDLDDLDDDLDDELDDDEELDDEEDLDDLDDDEELDDEDDLEDLDDDLDDDEEPDDEDEPVETRYDDNSPLPEREDEIETKPEKGAKIAEQLPPVDVHDPATAADLDLGPPEEWEDLLDEVEDFIAAEEAANRQDKADLQADQSDEALRESIADERWTVEKAPAVEAIVMEGDSLTISEEETSAEELEQLAEQLSIRAGESKPAKARTRILPVAALLLTVLFAGQLIHNQRETLATLPYFSPTLGKVYRFFNHPVVPRWDVRAWQFEVTAGSTDAEDQVLTITSTLSNQASKALPYPVIQVALTDRYDQIIETRAFGPRQYLAEPNNLRTGVASGQKFDAALQISSLQAEATGFKLNICYPATNQKMRCATGDFLH